MDTFLIILSFFFILLGIAGSFLPVIPGPLTGWIGLLLLFFTVAITVEIRFLVNTGILAMIVFLLDLIIPILGAKKFGGGKGSTYGSAIGLLIGILFLGPFGIIIGPFLGAFLGELYFQKDNTQGALKAAIGSLIGFLSGVFIKFIIGLAFLFYYVKFIWQFSERIF